MAATRRFYCDRMSRSHRILDWDPEDRVTWEAGNKNIARRAAGPSWLATMAVPGVRHAESSREVLHYLQKSGIAGCCIGVQLHGATEDWDPFPEFLDELRSAGADVVPIRVYRWRPADAGGEFDQRDPMPHLLHRLPHAGTRSVRALITKWTPASSAAERSRTTGLPD
jgi:hypothetical protein